MDLTTLLTPPKHAREVLLYILESEGIDIVVTSYAGRGTTRRALRELGLLRYVDNIIYNRELDDDRYYRVEGPNDPLFKLVQGLSALYSRQSPLTGAVLYS